ncbi:MAG: ABC transporter ATP-binding protein [Actinomycetota bacterium]|nr:ABC transporter ATP-binding protein [Actinomycetota bacterium]
MPDKQVLVEAQGLEKWFPVQKGFLANLLSRGKMDHVRAVDGVSFQIRRGEVFGLAGESGSGKSTVGRLVLGLLQPTGGKMCFDGTDLSTLDPEELRRLRRRMQIIFQDPLASLNPRMSIGEAIEHPARIHLQETPGEQRRHMVHRILEQVGLTPPRIFYDKYPHQISGGQRQRVVIARALITKPDLIVADEPIAMADVSVRVVLLDLMMRLKEEFDLTYLFITHDLATAKYICDRIAVMYLGKIVEIGRLEDVYRNPQHPYTRWLLAAVPVPDPERRRTERMPKGEIPNPINPPSGCRFHPRCPIYAEGVCERQVPPLAPVEGDEGHYGLPPPHRRLPAPRPGANHRRLAAHVDVLLLQPGGCMILVHRRP